MTILLQTRQGNALQKRPLTPSGTAFGTPLRSESAQSHRQSRDEKDHANDVSSTRPEEALRHLQKPMASPASSSSNNNSNNSDVAGKSPQDKNGSAAPSASVPSTTASTLQGQSAGSANKSGVAVGQQRVNLRSSARRSSPTNADVRSVRSRRSRSKLRRKPRGDSLERDISRLILQTAASEDRNSHFVIHGDRANTADGKRDATFILQDLVVEASNDSIYKPVVGEAVRAVVSGSAEGERVEDAPVNTHVNADAIVVAGSGTARTSPLYSKPVLEPEGSTVPEIERTADHSPARESQSSVDVQQQPESAPIEQTKPKLVPSNRAKMTTPTPATPKRGSALQRRLRENELLQRKLCPHDSAVAASGAATSPDDRSADGSGCSTPNVSNLSGMNNAARVEKPSRSCVPSDTVTEANTLSKDANPFDGIDAKFEAMEWDMATSNFFSDTDPAASTPNRSRHSDERNSGTDDTAEPATTHDLASTKELRRNDTAEAESSDKGGHLAESAKDKSRKPRRNPKTKFVFEMDETATAGSSLSFAGDVDDKSTWTEFQNSHFGDSVSAAHTPTGASNSVQSSDQPLVQKRINPRLAPSARPRSAGRSRQLNGTPMRRSESSAVMLVRAGTTAGTSSPASTGTKEPSSPASVMDFQPQVSSPVRYSSRANGGMEPEGVTAL